jgi:PAS domain S-box-containing protein
MLTTRLKNRELLNLSLVVIITIAFTTLSLTIDFIDTIYKYFADYSTLPINEFIINIVFLWLVVTLLITYHRWREAKGKQEELEDIISSINADVLVVVDKDMHITMCNDSVKRVFGYEVEEVINHKIDLLYSDICSELLNKNDIHDKLEMEGFYIGLATGKRKNGNKIPLEIITGKRSGHNGEVLLLREISERKKAEEKLQKAHGELEIKVDERTAELVKSNIRLRREIDERKQAEEGLRNALEELKKTQSYLVQSEKMFAIGQLAAGVAHEINNPITGIINYSQLLIDRNNGQKNDAEILHRIMKEGERIAGIVKNLLSFSSEQIDEHEPALMHDIINDTLSLMKKQILNDGIKLTVDVPVNLPRINARSQQVQQVFMNIIINARYALNKKYNGSHENKILKIKSEALKREGRNLVRTTFNDHGTGIPSDTLDKIYNPFFSTKPRGEGTGLGLSISYGIIKDHKGSLQVESVEGKHTKVMVDLPVYDTSSEEKSPGH